MRLSLYCPTLPHPGNRWGLLGELPRRSCPIQGNLINSYTLRIRCEYGYHPRASCNFFVFLFVSALFPLLLEDLQHDLRYSATAEHFTTRETTQVSECFKLKCSIQWPPLPDFYKIIFVILQKSSARPITVGLCSSYHLHESCQ